MTNQLAIIQKDITDSVNNKLGELQKEGLVIPQNYNASNALKSAFFKLQEVKDKTGRPALEVCTKDSIANSLLDMTVQGLSPAKTQCYFVVYGTQLQLQRSYFGTQTVLKRLSDVKDIWANVIYKDDVFEYENYHGRERLLSHKTSFENRDKDILGAYAIVQTTEGEEILTVMTKKEIETSWGQSKTSQSVHKKFPQEMAKRTVINRAAKAFVNTSDDSDLLIEAVNRSTENEYEPTVKDMGDIEEVKREIEQNANTEEIDIQEPPTPVQDADYEEVVQQEQQQASFADGPGF
ncbi:recombinase RecT [Lysinibacillus fusiformis]|uniref:recombinase RecT n=1 Tax=Lysinibacillus fusiformis TaxID=28031 RepID=UPI003D0340D4